jgi:alanine racemase
MIHSQSRPAWITLDHAALSYNYSQIKQRVPDAQVMAVIKANAYGHGMEWVAKHLSQADQFAVCSIDDLKRIRAAGITKQLSLLSALLSQQDYAYLQSQHAMPTIYDWVQLDQIKALDPQLQLDIWLKVDTGMGRLGFMPEQVAAVLETLKSSPQVKSIGLMSHLANADLADHPNNAAQLNAFNSLLGLHDWRQVSLLNSAGVVNFSDDAHDIVRPGIMLYGASPVINQLGEPDINKAQLRPVMSFYSRIISIKQFSAGQSIGYGSRYTCSDATKVGIVAVGYGDGYPRHAKTGTPVLVGEHRAELLGRVSMDMIAVNLNYTSAEVGDKVKLWGDGLPVEEVAYHADTISYELLCGVTERVQRIEL